MRQIPASRSQKVRADDLGLRPGHAYPAADRKGKRKRIEQLWRLAARPDTIVTHARLGKKHNGRKPRNKK